MRIITLDDIRDLLSKSKQRGLHFIFSKINPMELQELKAHLIKSNK